MLCVPMQIKTMTNKSKNIHEQQTHLRKQFKILYINLEQTRGTNNQM